MKQTRFTFPNSKGIMLSAEMEWPANEETHNYAIFAQHEWVLPDSTTKTKYARS